MSARARALLVMSALAAPAPAAARFNCEQSVRAQATWCARSQITAIPQREATAVCTEYTRRLAERCRPAWDQFASCQEFAERFSGLLVRTCEDRRLGRKPCRRWGDALREGPLGRCQRGKTGY